MTIEELKNKLEQDKALKAEMLEAIKAGREQEFLAAQGVEVPEKKELSDEELEGAAGGSYHGIIIEGPCQWDSKGRATHWNITQYDEKKILYYTCPKCGRLLHKGTWKLYYCDPCNDWFAGDWTSSAVEHIEPR